MVIHLKGQMLICSRLNLDQAKRESWIKEVWAYFPARVPLRRGERVYFGRFEGLLAKLLKELGAERIGHDGLKPKALEELSKAYGAEYLELLELVEELRKVKSKVELRLMRKAARLASLGMRVASELIERGRSELEIAAEVELAMRKAGSEGTPFDTVVASGENSWLPHARATSKRLGPRELVVVDLGARFGGYVSDMSRTFSINPTPKQARLLKLVERAQAAGLSKVKKGTKAREIDKAARLVVRRAKLERFYLHGTGHGLGLDVHEPPSLTPSSKEVLTENMLITVEPGVYIPGLGGARVEDVVLVKAERAELLTFKHQ